MKRMKLIILLSILSVVAISIGFSSCNKMDTVYIEGATRHIAYIYKTDSTDGVAYKNLLAANGCKVTLIDKIMAATTNFSSYQLIVIGHNNDVLSWTSSWTGADSANIIDSQKPLLLMGIGGFQFLNKINSSTNYMDAIICNDNSINVTEPLGDLFFLPRIINVSTTAPQIKLYPGSAKGVGQFAPSGFIDNFDLLGSFVVAGDYYPVTIEHNRFALFGFYKGVGSMTDEGKLFLVNLTYLIGKLS